MLNKLSRINLDSVYKAKSILKGVITRTPLELNKRLSKKYGAKIYLKREDLQSVRSYKIRGAYNKIYNIPQELRIKGIVAASAGNHAQGVAMACKIQRIKAYIFMPVTTPTQKVSQVLIHGGKYVEVKLSGDSFDDAYAASLKFAEDQGLEFVHPFDDEKIIEGQATVGLEMIEDLGNTIDYIISPLGGGGLTSGLSEVFKNLSPSTQIIAAEPQNAASMKTAVAQGHPVSLEHIDTFVDGAAVKRVGDLTYAICQENIENFLEVEVGKICTDILELYNRDGIVAEPAGVLSIAALEQVKDKIKNKVVVCVVSGGNNDITRMEDIKERSMIYEGLKHYFVVNFPQRSGALKEFLLNVLGENDDISFFEYSKKTSRTRGPAVVGIELKDKNDFEPLKRRMIEKGFFGDYLNNKPELFGLLI